MRAFSREIFVGFLLVLGLAASGCQPIQPLSSTSEDASVVEVVESEPVLETAALTETPVLTGTPVISGMAVVSVAVVSVEVTGTEAVTPTELVPVAISVAIPGATADPAMLAAGLAVYRSQYCGVCHTLDAAETRGTFGPVHNGLGAIAAARIQEVAYNGSATSAAEYIRESIVDPQVFMVSGFATTPHRMPTYAFLDVESVDALVAFLLAQ